MKFDYQPKGPFELMFQNQYFNGWPTLKSDPKTVVMTFPVERWKSSAAVTIQQLDDGTIQGEVIGTDDVKAKEQALAALSLDEDGATWPEVGKKDDFIGDLQEKYHFMRPSLFNSPYEATASFIIGHRIQMVQGRAIRQRVAEEHGEAITVKGETFHAFPAPQQLLKIAAIKGLNATKIERLHAIAQAALDGILDRNYLRGLSDEEALEKLETLPGIGPFFSQGILYRAVGIADGFTHDDLTYHAIKTANHFTEPTTKEQALKVAENWRPYRMWATVLLHVWLRETNNFPKRTFSKR